MIINMESLGLDKVILDEIDKLSKEPFDISKFPYLVRKVIEIVDKSENLSGYEKKDLVIKIVTALIDKTDLMDAMLPMIPVMIDQFFEVNNGKLELSKKVKNNCVCFK